MFCLFINISVYLRNNVLKDLSSEFCVISVIFAVVVTVVANVVVVVVVVAVVALGVVVATRFLLSFSMSAVWKAVLSVFGYVV